MSREMRPKFFHKVLHWCDTCHTPVLADRCSCGAPAREVPLTPPGDPRPAFPADIRQINDIFLKHFGAPLVPPGHITLLNKIPDQDRMDEIIVGGGVAASIRYLPAEREWEPIPRPEACTIFTPKKRYVTVSEGAVPFIRDTSMSVLAPGLLEIDDAVRAGDEVFVLAPDNSCIGVGRAKVDARTARTMEKGPVVRTRRNIPSLIIPGAATWDAAVTANTHALTRAEDASVQFIQDVTGKHPDMPVNVSFSGGKDSLATLLVAMKAIGSVPILFADTGLEFPETYINIQKVVERYGVTLYRTNGATRFWETFDKRGPPAVNARWCCRVCKLSPIADLIRKEWGECISFIGQRKYESAVRAQSRRIWRNPNIPAQLSAAPIHNWTALHVWLYLMREKAPYNVLYERQVDRIGCFMCPSSDMAIIHQIEQMYPELWLDWLDRLEHWRKEQDLPPEWITTGQWRIQEGCTDETDSHY